MGALKELVEELNKVVENLNSDLHVEDLVSLIEDVTRIAAALSKEIND